MSDNNLTQPSNKVAKTNESLKTSTNVTPNLENNILSNTENVINKANESIIPAGYPAKSTGNELSYVQPNDPI